MPTSTSFNTLTRDSSKYVKSIFAKGDNDAYDAPTKFLRGENTIENACTSDETGNDYDDDGEKEVDSNDNIIKHDILKAKHRQNTVRKLLCSRKFRHLKVLFIRNCCKPGKL